MDLKGVKPSTYFEDRTGWSPNKRKLHDLLVLLNPALAAVNAHEWMQAHGYAPIRSEVDFRKR